MIFHEIANTIEAVLSRTEKGHGMHGSSGGPRRNGRATIPAGDEHPGAAPGLAGDGMNAIADYQRRP